MVKCYGPVKKIGNRNKKGYTLIIAVIIMAVLLIIGIAVVTSAATGLNSVNQRTAGRQAYYAAKSALSVVDDSMNGGELGLSVRDKAYKKAVDGLKTGTADWFELPEQTELADVRLESGDRLKRIRIEEMKVRYSGMLRRSPGSNSEYKDYFSMKAVVSFKAEFGEESYRLKATYEYAGNAIPAAGGTRWEAQEWETKDIGQ